MRRCLLVSALVTCALLSACRSATIGPRVVVLFDVSTSASSASLRASYLRDFGLVAAAVARRRGSIRGEIIGTNPTADSATPIAMDFTPSSVTVGNALYEKAEAARQVRQILRQAAALLHRPGQSHTDIFSSLKLAERNFAAAPTKAPKLLVLFTDAIESDNRYEFDRLQLTPTHSRTIIHSLRREGLLPDLRGVTVYVVGAGLDRTGTITAARNFAIERFWRDYFAATGAHLSPGHYSARLLAFP